MRVLSAAQRQQFDDEGFVVVHDALDPILDIGPVLAEYADVLDEIALGLYATGTIDTPYADLPFPERLIRVCEAGGRGLPVTFQVTPGSTPAGIARTCPGGRLDIPDTMVPAGRALPLPMQPGSVLLMTQRPMPSSLDNVTDDQVRISMDLRYQPVGQPTGRPAF